MELLIIGKKLGSVLGAILLSRFPRLWFRDEGSPRRLILPLWWAAALATLISRFLIVHINSDEMFYLTNSYAARIGQSSGFLPMRYLVFRPFVLLDLPPSRIVLIGRLVMVAAVILCSLLISIIARRLSSSPFIGSLVGGLAVFWLARDASMVCLRPDYFATIFLIIAIWLLVAPPRKLPHSAAIFLAFIALALTASISQRQVLFLIGAFAALLWLPGAISRTRALGLAIAGIITGLLPSIIYIALYDSLEAFWFWNWTLVTHPSDPFHIAQGAHTGNAQFPFFLFALAVAGIVLLWRHPPTHPVGQASSLPRVPRGPDDSPPPTHPVGRGVCREFRNETHADSVRKRSFRQASSLPRVPGGPQRNSGQTPMQCGAFLLITMWAVAVLIALLNPHIHHYALCAWYALSCLLAFPVLSQLLAGHPSLSRIRWGILVLALVSLPKLIEYQGLFRLTPGFVSAQMAAVRSQLDLLDWLGELAGDQPIACVCPYHPIRATNDWGAWNLHLYAFLTDEDLNRRINPGVGDMLRSGSAAIVAWSPWAYRTRYAPENIIAYAVERGFIAPEQRLELAAALVRNYRLVQWARPLPTGVEDAFFLVRRSLPLDDRVTVLDDKTILRAAEP